jgi:hypothetical protein
MKYFQKHRAAAIPKIYDDSFKRMKHQTYLQLASGLFFSLIVYGFDKLSAAHDKLEVVK